MKVGDLAKDNTTNDIILVVSKNYTWIDQNGLRHCWDFEVMSSDRIYYVDAEEVQEIG